MIVSAVRGIFVRRNIWVVNVAMSIGRGRSGRVGWRCAIALLGIALLGATSAVREFDISIRDRHVEGGASTLRVRRGDTVLMRLHADETVSLHLHGYDLRADVTVASTTTLRFDATIAGRFPISAHEFGAAPGSAARSTTHREVPLLYLEVLPE